MKVLVCGGRDFNDRDALYESLTEIHNHHGKITELISGGATGADTIAIAWAVANNIPFTVFPANWRKYGNKAGILRNIQMLDYNPDLVVAFQGGRGTADMVNRSLKAGKVVVKVNTIGG